MPYVDLIAAATGYPDGFCTLAAGEPAWETPATIDHPNILADIARVPGATG